MKKLLLFLFFMSFNISAFAVEFGIFPFPKDVGLNNPSEYIKNYSLALKEVKNIIKNPINVSMVGWKKLEPDISKYRFKDEFGGMLYSVNMLGFTPFVGITTIDTMKRVLPDDLKNENWTSPELFERYKMILDEATSIIPRDIKFFIIGNEVDIYFEKNLNEVQAYLAFIQKAKLEIKKRFPQAQVSVSVTFDGLIKNRVKLIKSFIVASDMAIFTFYPMAGIKNYPIKSMPMLLDQLIQNAQKKEIFLQEVGFPSSPDAHSSPERQAEFFRVMIPEIAARPEIKYMSIFLMHDFSKSVCGGFTDYYNYDTVEFRGLLCSLGLKYDNGDPKLSWNAVIQAIQIIQKHQKFRARR